MRQRAFTLIELIVTTAIIFLLVGIMVPALGRAQASARRVSCSTQVKALVQAIACYAQENNAWLPPGPREMDPDGKFRKDPDRGHPLDLFASLRIGRADLSSQNGWYAQGLLWQQGMLTQPRTFYCPEMQRRGWGVAIAWPRHMEVAPNAAGEKASVMSSFVYRGGYASAAGSAAGTLSAVRNLPTEPLIADNPMFGNMVHSSGYTVGYLGGQVEFLTFTKPAITGTIFAPFWTAVGPTPNALPATP
jgi:type II secretory pathway pseudopilin PulG